MSTAFTITALNDATDSENRMHSDDVAARYGFKGALVSGVNVFGYMTQPLVAQLGTRAST
jgi:acyl dehydratase